MTDRKISELVAVTTVEDTDEFVLARAGVSNKIAGANLKTEVLQHVYDNGTRTLVAPYNLDTNGSPVPLAWSDEYPADDDIVDLTDPLAPVVREAGTYAVTVNFCVSPAAGKHAACLLDLFNDDPNTDMYASGTFALDEIVYDGATGWQNLVLHVTGKMPAGARILTRIQHNASGPLNAFPECMVCKIA